MLGTPWCLAKGMGERKAYIGSLKFTDSHIPVKYIIHRDGLSKSDELHTFWEQVRQNNHCWMPLCIGVKEQKSTQIRQRWPVHQLHQTRNTNYNKAEKEGDTTPGVSDWQGIRACYSPWGSKPSVKNWSDWHIHILIQTQNGCTTLRVVYYTRFNNRYMKIITDEYLSVWLKGYKNMYSYKNKVIWVNMHGRRNDHTKWSEVHRERQIPNIT